MPGLHDPLGDLIDAFTSRSRLYEVTALEPDGARLQANEEQLRLPLTALPQGVKVGDMLNVTTRRGESVEVELERAASGRPQTSAVHLALLYILLATVLAVFSQALAAFPFQNLGPRVQPLVRYGVIAFLVLVTTWSARRMLLDTPPKLEELRNRYGRNDFLLWVLEQPADENDGEDVRAFRQRWEHLRPRPVQAALVGGVMAGLAVAAGLPPVYGLVIVTSVCALFEVTRRRIFARWSAAHAQEAEALVWSEAFAPYRDRLASARVNLLKYRSQG